MTRLRLIAPCQSGRFLLLAAIAAIAGCSSDEAGTDASGGAGGKTAGVGGTAGSSGSAAFGASSTIAGRAGTTFGGALGYGGAPSLGGALVIGGTSNGGSTSGGSTSGGASLGGAASGGENNGGATSGGAAGGDTSSGGRSSGGSSSGGATSGGAISGGASSGGATSGGATSGGASSGGATSGGATSGGASSGGSTSCPDQQLGWSTVNGAVTGGGNAAPVTVTNASDLIAYAADSSARVIQISGTITAPEVQVNSNKTLVGIGTNATLMGGLRIRGSSSSHVTNVILQNLRIDGPDVNDGDNNEGDGVQIYYADHVWVDHCEIFDSADGNLDIIHASHWVTVSWTRFRYSGSAPDPDHKFCNLVGHSDDNGDEDTNRLGVTFHHNWWDEGVIERMPRVRFGQVHVVNNYFNAPGNNYCVRAGSYAHLLVESNYFQNVNNPEEFNNSDDQNTANITARNNVYDNSGDELTGGGGTPFTDPPYSMPIDDPNVLPELVQRCAGPR